jgi:tetratricopeptide (TPR) repeat protein
LLSALELVCGHFDRSREYMEAWLRLVSPDMDAFVVSAHRSVSALYLARTGHVEHARKLLKAQFDAERHREEWQSSCATGRILGEMLLEQNEFRAAQPYLEEATSLAAQWAPQDLTYLWRFQAKAAIGLGDYGHAWHCLDQALRISRQNRQKDREAWTRWDMADLAFQEGRWEETEAQIRACILAHRENEEEPSIVQCLLRLAEYCLGWGQHERAVTLLGSAKRGVESLGLRRTQQEESQFRNQMDKTGASLDKAAWRAAWKRGNLMTLDEAVEFAREPPSS